MYGADDFLPMLTYVVAQCDVPQLDTEVEYMMELLDPSLLQGEGRFRFRGQSTVTFATGVAKTQTLVVFPLL